VRKHETGFGARYIVEREKGVGPFFLHSVAEAGSNFRGSPRRIRPEADLILDSKSRWRFAISGDWGGIGKMR
jgi:hypothetical protein